MINGIRLKQNNLSPNQRRLRLQELSGIEISVNNKKRLLSETVSMVEIPKKSTQEPNDGEIDLEEILNELGYGDTDDYHNEVEDDDNVGEMSREELKELIQRIVLDTMQEEEELHEIIENLTR